MSEDQTNHHPISSPTSLDGHASSRHPKFVVQEKVLEEGEDDEANGKREMDLFKGRYLFWLAYQSVGVIYGDIGTSPLYVYSSTFRSAPSYDDLLGALSLIIWTVTLMVSIKYVIIVLRADDEGEGGTFAIYSLLSRYVRQYLPCPSNKLLSGFPRPILCVETHERKDQSRWNGSMRPAFQKQASTLDPSLNKVRS
ncbi:MAG: hypothetical protein Q9166_001761 [cf. Caloplaca sp. 2 TL-2023]